MPIGRLGFTEGALPRISAVHYSVRADEVIVACLTPVKISAAGPRDILAFEIDCYDPSTGEGWYVSVVGEARPIIDPTQIADLDTLPFSPFAPGQDRRYIAIQIGVIGGRRLSTRRRENTDSASRTEIAKTRGQARPTLTSPAST